MGIQLQVSSDNMFKLNTSNWTPMWLCADYLTIRLMENQSQSIISVPSMSTGAQITQAYVKQKKWKRGNKTTPN